MQDWKVLLVDDEEEFASTLAERLRLRGIDATTASCGEEALLSIAAHPPTIVILDVMMPGISGLEVLRRVKADLPNMPVILLTGIGSNREGIDGMRMGAFDYLMKPINIDDLLAKMGEAIKHSAGGTQ